MDLSPDMLFPFSPSACLFPQAALEAVGRDVVIGDNAPGGKVGPK